MLSSVKCTLQERRRRGHTEPSPSAFFGTTTGGSCSEDHSWDTFVIGLKTLLTDRNIYPSSNIMGNMSMKCRGSTSSVQTLENKVNPRFDDAGFWTGGKKRKGLDRLCHLPQSGFVDITISVWGWECFFITRSIGCISINLDWDDWWNRNDLRPFLFAIRIHFP